MHKSFILFYILFIVSMNKLFKKSLALLACTALIGQTMLINVVGAVDELIKDVDLNLNQKILESNSDKVLPNEASPTNENSAKAEDSQQDSSDNNLNEKSTTASSESKECSSETVTDFMDSLTELINDAIENSESTGFKRAEASNDSIILYVESEDVELPDLDGYISWLVDHILWKEAWDKTEIKFWDDLASQNKWLQLSITDVTNLIDFNLGETDTLYARFDDCYISFNLELEVDDSESNTEDDNNGGSNNNYYNECSSDVKTTFMNTLTELINDTIKDSNNTGFKRAEPSDNSIILYVEDENVKLPDLNGYITWLVDHILWKENRDKPERQFWDALAVRNNWLELTVTNVMNLVDINLGNSNKLYIYFKDCSFTLNLELKVENQDSGWSNNDDYQCSSEVKATLINTLTDTVNEVIKKSSNTGFKRAEWSLENDTLILYVENENVKIPDLTEYILALTDYILGKNLDKAEVKFWGDLASKNKWILMNVTAVTNLINLNLNNRNYVVVNYRDCNFPLKIELKVDNNSNWNGGSWYSWGWSSGWGSSNWWSSSSNSGKWKDSNKEEITLSWEVADDTDDKMEVKKAETCSIEWSTFSDEENQAYLWACEKWITIADNIMKANMNRNLTRAELAKMMSVYSEELLWKTRVKNESVSYPDVTDKLWDLAYYIQEWYKLQIMGIHADGSALSKFLPNSNVTRWEFGTVFSRVLYGDKYNINGANYYEKHLEVLKDAGILRNTNPKLIEKRGWILLMLYRSQKVEASNWNISNEEIANISGENEENNNNTDKNN